MKGDKDRVLECTTGTFDGLIAMVNPQDSWVVRNGPPLCTADAAEASISGTLSANRLVS